MSCYFRHMREILDEAGVEITKENKKEVDQIIHSLVSEAYKNCSPAWKAVKEQIKGDDKVKRQFITKLKKAVEAI